MVRFVENPHVGSTILSGYQGNLNKQGNVQIPVVVRFVGGFSVKVEAANGAFGGGATQRNLWGPSVL